MDRMAVAPRPDWPARVEALGLTWHSIDGRLYWDESACYRFSPHDIKTIEQATTELYRMLIIAGDAIIDRDLLSSFNIPSSFHAAIRDAWQAEPRALNYGRFDLGYDGDGPPKLFEFNCETPTSLLEAAVVQWDWKEEVFPGFDQFNQLHDRLVERWRDIAPPAHSSMLHLAHARDPSGEDMLNVAYMADTAAAAGIATQMIVIDDIGWDAVGKRFVDLERREIDALYHLYPWEWLVREDFAPHILDSFPTTLWIEPVWKMMWNTKAILPLLWELFPGHPNLLPASRTPLDEDHVRKPMLSREGQNVDIMVDGRPIAATGGDYGDEGYIYQALYRLPGTGEQRPVIGSWVIDGQPAGIGIREGGLITSDTARFVPHIIAG